MTSFLLLAAESGPVDQIATTFGANVPALVANAISFILVALILKSLSDIERMGDYVVHVEHGIGRFEGLKTIEALAAKYQATLRIWPVDFGTIFAGSGGLPLPKPSSKKNCSRRRFGRCWSTCACGVTTR